MKEKMTIVQLRSTIFLQQNIGYTPDTAKQFETILLPGANVFGIPQPGIPLLGTNPDIPQYGLSWRLFKRIDGAEYNIVFQPGKIDIVVVIETPFESNFESEFCQQSIDWFSKILDTQKASVTRIAYAPLYAIAKDSNNNAPVWNSILKKTVLDGTQLQDINLSFLMKRIEKFGDLAMQMNLLHNIFDGIQTKQNNGTFEVHNVLLFQLDLNSIPEKNINLNKEGVQKFFNHILIIKDRLVENVEV